MKCLDTNAIIAVLNDWPAGARGRLAEELANGERIGIPTVALFELIYGYEKRAQRAQNEAALRSLLTLDVEPLPFELADAEHADRPLRPAVCRASARTWRSPRDRQPTRVRARARARRRGLGYIVAPRFKHAIY